MSKKQNGPAAASPDNGSGSKSTHDNNNDLEGSKQGQRDIARFLKVLHPNDLFEVRTFGLRGKGSGWSDWTSGVVSGYFDNHEQAAQAILTLEKNGAEGIYVTLNPVIPALLARSANRLQGNPKATTGDKDIITLRYLLLDFDPERSSGISSSDAELSAALELRDKTIAALKELGWPDPFITGMSGNGGHAIYLLPDLPNAPEKVQLLKRVLAGVSEKFSNEAVNIDTAVYNPARITKVLGTTTRKGDDIPNRPHRRSSIDKVNDEPTLVTIDLLEAMASEAPTSTPVTNKVNWEESPRLDVQAFLTHYGREVVEVKPHGGATLYVLKECVFNPEHKGKEAAIGQQADGKLFYQCFHDSCQGQTWQEARKIISGDDSLNQFMIANEREDNHNKMMEGKHAQQHSELEMNEPYTVNASSQLLPALPPFPLEVLPSKYREVVERTGRAFMVPLEIPACTLISLVGACVGRTRGLVAKAGYIQHANLYLVLVARSGIGKSPCSKALFDTIFDIENQHYQEYQQELVKYNSAVEERRRAGNDEDKAALPIKPVFQQIYVNDATPESLTDAFEANLRGILWYTDELASLLLNLDKYNPSGRDGGTRSRLAEAYDSGPWKRSRRGEGCTHIRHACLSIFGTVQGGILNQVFTHIDAATGFLPRFLFVRAEPDIPPFWKEETFDDSCEKAIADLIEKLLALNFDSEGKPILIEIDEEAKREYISWHDRLAAEPWTNFDGYIYEALSAKLRGQCLRLCLILHILESVTIGRSEATTVTIDTMRKAITLADWFKEHQRQVWRLLGKARRVTEASPLEKRVAAAIVELENEIDQGILPTARITEKINEEAEEGLRITADSVGKSYKKLGLQPHHLPDRSARGVRITTEKIRELKSLVQKGVQGVPSVRKQEMTGTCEPDTSPERCPTCPENAENQRTPRTSNEEDVQPASLHQTNIPDTSDGSDIFSSEEKIPPTELCKEDDGLSEPGEWVGIKRAIDMIIDPVQLEQFMKYFLDDRLEELDVVTRIDRSKREMLIRIDTLPTV